MTYTHLTTNELVMIEAYYQENIKVSDIVTSLGRSKQTIYNVINYLKEGHSTYDYYNRYKINKKRCAGIKPVLRNQKKNLSNIFERPSYVFFIAVIGIFYHSPRISEISKQNI